VINESILGAALIRLVNSQRNELIKFVAANTQAFDIGVSILRSSRPHPDHRVLHEPGN
jgi:ATP-binding cassette subfamily B protein